MSSRGVSTRSRVTRMRGGHRRCRGASILVYAKPNHEPASFTVLNFPVEDVEAAVDELNARGVVTKFYDDPQLGTDAKGISHGQPGSGPGNAGVRAPAGNVLAVLAPN